MIGIHLFLMAAGLSTAVLLAGSSEVRVMRWMYVGLNSWIPAEHSQACDNRVP